MEENELEFTLLNKRDVLVYQIPPASSSAGHKADDWKKCIWRGRCRVAGKGTDLIIKMIDAHADKLFAQCTIPNGEYDKYVERVIDSSRYFVLKITNGQRHAFIGLGFDDRNDAFDFNCTLSDFKSTWVDRDKKVEEELPATQAPSRDLSLKEGQKITINIKGMEGRPRRQQAAEPTGSSFAGLLAPPPSSGQSRHQRPEVQLAAPQPPAVAQPPVVAQSTYAAVAQPPGEGSPCHPIAPSPPREDDLFGDFEDFQSAASTGPVTAQATAPPPGRPPPDGVRTPGVATAVGPAGQLDHLSLSGALTQQHPVQPSAPGLHWPTGPGAQPAQPPVTPVTPDDPFSVAAPQPQAAMQSAPSGKALPTQVARGGGDPFDEFDIFK